MPSSEQKANILLVDDQPANLLALEAVLDDLGHNLVKAASGEQALRLLLDKDFAVVLLDVQMPGLDGFETAQRIRAGDRSRHTPIIFLTGYDDNRLSVQQAYSLGAVDFLVKPLVPVILRAKVTGFVDLFQKTEQVKRQAERLRQMEQQEFERRLAEENARFRALIEYSWDAVALIRQDGTIIYMSPSSSRILGYEPEEQVGRGSFDLVHPEDVERVQERLADLIRDPATPVRVEVRARHKDGSWCWVECVGTNLLGKPPVEAIVVNFRDITERRRTTEALRESEQRFRQLAENIHAVFWMSDLRKERILYVSPAYETIWGRSCQSLYDRPRSFFEAIHPDDQEHVLTLSLEHQARGESTDIEYRVIHADGSVRWVRDRAFPIREPSGQVSRIAGIAEDITDRREAKEALQDSERRLRSIVDNWPSAIFVKDLEGHYLLANRGCERISGEPAERIIGKTDFDYFAREIAERMRADDQRVLAAGAAVRYEETVPSEGEDRTLLTVKFPLLDTSGTPYGVCGITTDITDLKRAEEGLREADRRKDEFLAMLAHELRNPLAPVRNAVQVLKLLGPADPNLRRAQEMIQRQVEHLARLVDDLLDVSRITRGKINLHKEPIELAPVIARAVETSRPLVDARRHELTVTLSPEPVLIEGDATRLAQVLSNLLNNAAKYSGEGARILLTAERRGNEAVVSVRDTGIGIPADLLPQVFDLFTQGDRSLARSEGGLGIGLTLVKTLVEMHGGRVEAKSDGPGEGSEFIVHLPVLERRRSRNADPETNHSRPHVDSRRILVVDDNVDAAESLALLLQMEGHEVRTMHDGPSALDTAASFRPEVIFLDIGLPRMDGYEVARRLRGQVGLKQTVLVALTGYGQDEDRRRAETAGFNAHLIKPADPAELHELLATVPALD